MRILFVDHVCHRRTGSADFFLEILRRHFSVDVHYYEETYKTGLTDTICEPYDVIVYWEFLPSRRKLVYADKPTVFVPMYDNEWGSYFQWRRIARSGISVISFCKAITRHARRCGVRDLLELQYFPDPARFDGLAGDPRVVLLWERGAVSFDTVKKLFPPEQVKEVRILRRKEEGTNYPPLPKEDFERWHVTVIETAFAGQEEYFELLRPAGVVVAPRLKEGIGMTFLEAMAMGKVVVAHNDATMNEYITDGENGFLFDISHPCPLDHERIESVHATCRSQIARMRSDWLSGRAEVLNFFSSLPPCRSELSDRLFLFLSLPLFVAEWVLWKARGGRG